MDCIPDLRRSHKLRTKPTHHSYWACALEPESHDYEARVLQPLNAVHARACALQQERQGKGLGRVLLFVTPCTRQSMEFSRPECWSGLPFPSPGDLPNLGIEPRPPALQEDALPAKPPQLEACAPQLESSPCFLQPEKSLCSKENPVQPKTKSIKLKLIQLTCNCCIVCQASWETRNYFHHNILLRQTSFLIGTASLILYINNEIFMN